MPYLPMVGALRIMLLTGGAYQDLPTWGVLCVMLAYSGNAAFYVLPTAGL